MMTHDVLVSHDNLQAMAASAGTVSHLVVPERPYSAGDTIRCYTPDVGAMFVKVIGPAVPSAWPKLCAVPVAFGGRPVRRRR